MVAKESTATEPRNPTMLAQNLLAFEVRVADGAGPKCLIAPQD